MDPALQVAQHVLQAQPDGFRLGEGKLYLATGNVTDNAYVVCERVEDTIVFTESVQEQVFTPERMPVTLVKENG